MAVPTTDPDAAPAVELRDALVERLVDATAGALELFGVHLGWRLGLYGAMAGAGPVTSARLAQLAGIDERYAREWLEQQAVAGMLLVANGGQPRSFMLPPEYVGVLADPLDPAHVAPYAAMIVGIGGAMPDVVDAYRTGSGVPYPRYGKDFRDGQGSINRPAYTHELAGWIGSVPALHERLANAAGPARIADLGCGQGHSTRALAAAYPHAQVVGVDTDVASIADAERFGTGEGWPKFYVADAASLADSGPYDLVCMFEVLHDLAHPVPVLTAVRQALTHGGALLVAEERVAETFTAPGDTVERMMYGWSISHCLPASRDDETAAALGTVLRPGRVQQLAAESGFRTARELPIANDSLRFYLLMP